MMTRILIYALIGSAGIILVFGVIRYRALSTRKRKAERAWDRLQRQIEHQAKVTEETRASRPLIDSPSFGELFDRHEFHVPAKVEIRADHHQLVQAQQKVEFAAEYYNSLADQYNAGLQAKSPRWVVRLGKFDSMQRYEYPQQIPEVIQDP